MINVATRASRLGTFLFKCTKKESRKSSLSQCRNTFATCSRGYVVTCNDKSLYSNKNLSEKADLFVRNICCSARRQLSTEQDLQSLNFEKISTETLESLSEYFDEIIEDAAHLQDADVSCGDGVLTVKFGNEYGTYVINRQVPNQQIWLSSPKSGPKRYDFIDGTWIYKHDGQSLHELLNAEIPDVVKFPVSFDKCSYSVRQK
ncbi:hypothetical protein TSAR_004720 [Trichomalopsis sarcophagae]|uniref:ferroxidase n=1 Tax=Trichomalopsis sarcophagae TaxID=543379 RepID=A0A232FLA6_9HYME|nr:hypothetical protein TSAR_004720 [Trichomalopsis sarcophagae]